MLQSTQYAACTTLLQIKLTLAYLTCFPRSSDLITLLLIMATANQKLKVCDGDSKRLREKFQKGGQDLGQ